MIRISKGKKKNMWLLWKKDYYQIKINTSLNSTQWIAFIFASLKITKVPYLYICTYSTYLHIEVVKFMCIHLLFIYKRGEMIKIDKDPPSFLLLWINCNKQGYWIWEEVFPFSNFTPTVKFTGIFTPEIKFIWG